MADTKTKTDEKSTGTATQDTFQRRNKTVMIASSIGALAGLGYAFNKGKGFWGYVGFFILGSIAGTLVGTVINKDNK